MSTTSIIVPVYNAEKYLCEAVDSVLAQTSADWQLILVDDGSTDSSSDICDHYAAQDSRIVVVHIPNGGQSYARNRGLEIAEGEWIAFLDADDCMHPDLLKTLYSIATETGGDVVGARHYEGDEFYYPTSAQSKFVTLSPSAAIETTLYQRRGLTSGLWGKIYRRELFDGVRFVEGLYYEDLEIIFRIYERAAKLSFSDAELYFYRQHSQSFIHSWNSRRLDVLTVVDGIEKRMAELHPELLSAARDRKLSANFNIFNLATKNGERATADRCWKVIKKYRCSDLFNPKIRLKNRLGILASYLGRWAYTKLFL